jgi:hypothetical protein
MRIKGGEALAAAGLSALFYWGLRFLPALGIVAIPAAALPLVRYAARRGVVPAIAPLVAATALCGGAALVLARVVLSGSPGLPQAGRTALTEAASYLAVVGACTVAAGLSRRLNPSAVFAGLCAVGAIVVAILWLANPNADAALLREYDTQARSWVQAAREGGQPSDTIRAMELTLTFGAEHAPGLLASFWILIAAPAFFLGRKLAGLTGGFSNFRVPPIFAVFFVAAGGAAATLTGEGRRAAVDLLVPVLVLYFLSGLSIIAHFARRWIRLQVLRAGLYVAASWPPFAAVTAGLGLFDWYFDFRRKADDKERDHEGHPD